MHEAINDELVERAVEVAAPVQQPTIDGQRFAQLVFVWSTHAVNQRRHGGVGRQQIGKHGQQRIADVAHGAAAHIQIKHADKLAVGARVGDERHAARVADLDGRGHGVVRMPAQDGVQPAHARGELQVDIHAVVRQQHDHLGALAARLVNHLLQPFFLNAEGPVRREIRRVRDRRVRKRLPDDGDRHAVQLAQHVRVEYRITKVGGLDVLRDKGDLVLEIVVDHVAHAVGAVGHLPVRGHDVHTQREGGVDHVLAVGPQRGGGALPGVAAVQQQRIGARGAQPLDERGQVREAAHAAVAAGGLGKVERGEGVRGARARRNAVTLEQRVPDQMRRLPGPLRHTEVDAGLAVFDGQQLRVAVGEVQQVDVAEAWHVIAQRIGVRVGQAQAGGCGNRQGLNEFAAVHCLGLFA